MNRRRFLKGAVALGASVPLLSSLAYAKSMDPTILSTLELRAMLDEGRLSSVELVKACLSKIGRLDSQLHSVIEVNPEAVDIAARWDSSGNRHSPLGGLPVLLKDNIATSDMMVTSAGSAALAGSHYPKDSAVAARLRAAGAVLLGKTNMSEWANYRSSNSTSGWSARGGQCHNPYVLDRSPCGSSSGSAVAVSAGLCPLAVGTETVGSIVCPSGISGIVGFKPTSGLVPGENIIPIAPSWETAGAMARSVQEAAHLQAILAGWTDLAPFPPEPLKGARLGVARQFFGFDSRVDAMMETELKRLTKLGATLVDPVKVPGWDSFGKAAQTVMKFEFKAFLNEYLEGQAPELKVRTLAEVIAFNSAHPKLEAMDNLGQSVLVDSQATSDLQDPVYRIALREVASLARDALARVFEEHRLDAIVGPTNGPAWTIDFVNGDHYEGGCAAPAAVGGCPHLTVPAGFVGELPVGLSFFGPRDQDLKILQLGHHYESQTNHRQWPRMLSTLS